MFLITPQLDRLESLSTASYSQKLALARHSPQAPNPFFSLPQIPLFIPITFVLGCVFMIIVSFWAAPFECLIGSGIILTGIPAYLLGYKWKKPHVIKKMLGEWRLSAVVGSVGLRVFTQRREAVACGAPPSPPGWEENKHA